MKKFIAIFLSFLTGVPVFSATSKTHKYYEKDYQNVWCQANGGVSEYILPDKTRVLIV